MSKVFKTVNEWDSSVVAFASLFNDCNLFTSLGFDSEDLYDYFLVYYGERLVMKPWSREDLDNSNAAAKLQKIVKYFCMTNQYKYEKLLDTLNFTYDPICNYDMTEEGTDTRLPDLTKTNTAGGTDTSQSTAAVLNSETNSNSESEITTYESNTFNPLNRTDASSSSTSNSSGGQTVNYGRTDTEKETGTDTTNHKLTRKGNIGVMTTQDMINAEREVAAFDIIRTFFTELNNYILLNTY